MSRFYDFTIRVPHPESVHKLSDGIKAFESAARQFAEAAGFDDYSVSHAPRRPTGPRQPKDSGNAVDLPKAPWNKESGNPVDRAVP